MANLTMMIKVILLHPHSASTVSLIGVEQGEHVVAGALPADVGPHVARRVLHRQQVRSVGTVSLSMIYSGATGVLYGKSRYIAPPISISKTVYYRSKI